MILADVWTAVSTACSDLPMGGWTAVTPAWMMAETPVLKTAWKQVSTMDALKAWKMGGTTAGWR
ncbi:hypothetical protein AAFN47_04485 [Hoeflea sp. CAU 1731]